MITVGFGASVTTRTRAAHLHALATRSVDFAVVSGRTADIVVGGRGDHGRRAVLSGLAAAEAPDTELGDSIVDWDAAVIRWLADIGSHRPLVRAIELLVFDESIEVAQATARRFMSRALPETAVPDTVVFHPTESRAARSGSLTWRLPALSVSASAALLGPEGLELEATAIGVGYLATVRVPDRSTGRPSVFEARIHGVTEPSEIEYSSALRNLWVHTAASHPDVHLSFSSQSRIGPDER